MSAQENLPGNQPYYKQLDGLRFIAVSAVMYCHWVRIPHMAFVDDYLGGSGVNLFFVLSGFLITQILIKSKLARTDHWFSFRQFYIRRCIRIMPIYYLAILVAVILNFKPSRESIWWLITFTGNICYTTQGPQAMGSFGHFWSLAVEEQFYLIFPFFVLYTPKRYLLHALYGIVIAAPVVRLLFYLANPTAGNDYFLTPCCMDSFALGGILAYYTIFNQQKLAQLLSKHWFYILNFCLFIALGALYYCFTFTNPNIKIPAILFYRLTFSVCSFWVMGVASQQGFKGRVQSFLENKRVVYLGKISYGLYLYHMLMPPISIYLHNQLIKYINLHKIADALHIHRLLISSPITAVWYISLTILVSTISWYVVENPMNGLKKYFSYAETPRPQST
jgi:peptidoglycan/LPS O-acetylase OafA/YrhL